MNIDSDVFWKLYLDLMVLLSTYTKGINYI